MNIRTRLLAMGALLSFAVPVFAQTQPAPAKQDPPKKEEPKKEDPKEEKSPYKKYADVITDKAVSQDGMFKVHRIEDKVYFEIPESMLEKDLLWQTELAELPTNVRARERERASFALADATPSFISAGAIMAFARSEMRLRR